MSPLLEQFLQEARDFLQGIGEKLMQMEAAPQDKELVDELFRLVHTLKGNSGLFDFPEMTRVLHAGEDLMDAIRNARVAYSQELADRLLDAMDFVGMLCDEIQANGELTVSATSDAVRLAESLRQLIPAAVEYDRAEPGVGSGAGSTDLRPSTTGKGLWEVGSVPEAARMTAYARAQEGGVYLVNYAPAEGCFYQGDDPFHQARQTPGLLWGGISPREPWPSLEALDAYRCVLDFHVLSAAPRDALLEHYRYVPDQIQILPVPGLCFAVPQGDHNGGPVYEDFVSEALGYLEAGDLARLERAAQTLIELSNPALWFASVLRWLLLVLAKEPQNRAALRALIEALTTMQPPDWSGLVNATPVDAAPALPLPVPASLITTNPGHVDLAYAALATQRGILALPDDSPWKPGRILAAAATIGACLKCLGSQEAQVELEAVLAAAPGDARALLAWLDGLLGVDEATLLSPPASAPQEPAPVAVAPELPAPSAAPAVEGDIKFGRRAEDAPGSPKSLKVDQAKIDRLMNLIGEMVVSKNALPYLAGRAETVFGVRDLSREIKAQYAVINRIAEEMQDAIMQVRMMPVSFVFQRFPRLVRDISRKLEKKVNLSLSGEETEADKSIIEALSDPLVHIVRNSLDHGFELPAARRAAGKPDTGLLTLRASQESGRVLIEIQDDGKGIDPAVIKRKAYERGLIDEATLERISDQEALNLVFAPGLSTATVVSDLSGRGVGMDVVRTAVEKVNGNIHLESELGKGTRIRLSLPLSMAVTNVIIIESDGQVFGVPMDNVIETVRIPAARIRTIKNSQVTVLRGRIVALKSLNGLLGLSAPPIANDDGELAVLVVRHGEESVGLLVDHFHETVDIILKPMAGVLGGLSAYAGSALMGDGSVLMVLNIKGVF
jgi:two-component system, chemotaxis family, sensor kinase CheA